MKGWQAYEQLGAEPLRECGGHRGRERAASKDVRSMCDQPAKYERTLDTSERHRKTFKL